MKPRFELLVLVAVVIAAPAAAYDIVQNGGFETASLASWQIFNQGASGGQGSWYANSGGNGTYSGLPSSAPPAGGWQAVADNNGRAAAILYQDVTIPATTRAVLSFVVWHGNAAPGGAYVNGSSLSPSSTNQRVRVDLITTGTNLLTTTGALAVLYATAPGTAQIVAPTTITQDLTAFAGQTVRLRVALVATNGGLIAGIDNVRLEVSPFSLLPQQLAGLGNGSAHWGDFDNDGVLDVSLNGTDLSNPYWTIYRYNAGAWSPYSQPLSGLVNGGTGIGDIDRDGDLDIAGVGSTVARLHDLVVYRNDGPLTFTSLPTGGGPFDPGTYDGSIDWGDYDNDGDLDALMTGTGQAPFFGFDTPMTFVGRNEGNGALSAVYPSLAQATSGNAAWIDLDNEGYLGLGVCGSAPTELYLGNGAGVFTSFFPGLPSVTNGAMAVGDLDNDGIPDFVLTGLNGGVPFARVYGSIFTEVNGLIGVSDSWVSLGDFDHDGMHDIAMCGMSGGTRITRIYRNVGDGTFSDIGAGLPGIAPGTVEFGDFEGDGDLDLLIQGETGAGRIAQVYLNSPPISNAAPAPPGSPYVAWWNEAEPTLTFTYFGTDDHTAHYMLTNNFRAGTSPGTCNIIPPMSNLSTGRRLIPRPGEAHGSFQRHLPIKSFGHGSLYWSVQSVDQSYQGSAWSPEQRLTIGPGITQILDIPQDQGGQVRLLLERSLLDDVNRTAYPASGYNVWRRIPGTFAETIEREGLVLDAAVATARLLGKTKEAAAISNAAEVTDLPLVEWQGRLFTRSTGQTLSDPFPPGAWEVVGSFYAIQDLAYVVVAPTLADSGTSGPHDDSFIVTVHTSTPSVWFASLPASGHSVDNLAPAAPVGVTAAYHTGGGNHLTWQPAPEPDFAAFHIHRSTSPMFVPGPATLVATVTSPDWTDPSHDAPGVYYLISTVDHAGNQSGFAGPGNVTAVDPAPAVTFGLSAASPNPFMTSTRIGFTLPHATAARLEVFDTAGRLVRTLVDAVLAAGEHQTSWDASDRSGQHVGPGVYFYRLRAGTFSASRRVLIGR